MTKSRTRFCPATVMHRVDAYLRRENISAAELGRRAADNIQLVATVRKAAQRGGSVSAQTLHDLAHEMGTTIGYLIGETEDPAMIDAPLISAAVMTDAAEWLFAARITDDSAEFARSLSAICQWVESDPDAHSVSQINIELVKSIVNTRR